MKKSVSANTTIPSPSRASPAQETAWAVPRAGDWTANSVAPRAMALDKNGAGEVKDGNTVPGAELSEFYKEAIELQLIGVSADPKFGGMGAPLITMLLSFVQINRACI